MHDADRYDSAQNKRMRDASRIIASHRESLHKRYGFPLPPEVQREHDEFTENIAVIFGFRDHTSSSLPEPPPLAQVEFKFMTWKLGAQLVGLWVAIVAIAALIFWLAG